MINTTFAVQNKEQHSTVQHTLTLTRTLSYTMDYPRGIPLSVRRGGAPPPLNIPPMGTISRDACPEPKPRINTQGNYFDRALGSPCLKSQDNVTPGPSP